MHFLSLSCDVCDLGVWGHLCDLCCTATVRSTYTQVVWRGFASERKKHLVNLLKIGDETKIKLFLLEILCLLCSTPIRLGFGFSFLLAVSCTLLEMPTQLAVQEHYKMAEKGP